MEFNINPEVKLQQDVKRGNLCEGYAQIAPKGTCFQTRIEIQKMVYGNLSQQEAGDRKWMYDKVRNA